jgi:hypothetical protein
MAVNIFEFALYYMTSFIVYDVPVLYEIFVYLFRYFTQIANSLFPVVLATAMLVFYSHTTFLKSLAKALPYTLTLLLYLFPYWAFNFAYQYIEVSGVIILSLLYALGYLVIFYVKTLLLFLLMIFFVKIFASKAPTHQSLEDIIAEKDALDFSKPAPKSIFLASLALFIYNIVLELTTVTIPYFKDSMGIYLAEEIFSLVLSYAVILVILLLCYLTSFFVKNKLHN